MKKIIISLALLMVASTATVSAAGKAKKAKTARIVCSQGFQGPELWNKLDLPVDNKGYISIFDGTSLDGWRGYGRSYVPSKWIIEDGALKFDSKKEGGEGGEIIFAHEFKNFELQLEWKISKGGNSGIFYLAKELATPDGRLESIVVSAPEYQVLDNANHPDAKMGKDGNRMSASLYDMIPAKPQNQKPYGEWNHAIIRVENGTVSHYQNGVLVVKYQLWTPEWIEMLQNSKFSEKAWPAAFEHFSNAGGCCHKGFIGLQDHGDDVWYRNIKVKILD